MIHRFARQIFPWVYSYRSLPGPGVENAAYLNEALPFQTPIGPGVANARQWWWQVPLAYQDHLIGVQGIGGLIHGQVYGTPLTDVQS